MRVVQVRRTGAPDVMRVEEAAEPRPGPGEVLVAVERAGVLYGDVLLRSGAYPRPLPYVPGLEVGGRVVALGPRVDPALLGTRVVATTVGSAGGYAERAVARAADVYPVPAGLALDHAVAVFQAGAVAVGLLSAMRVAAGESVLVTAAAGRIGSLLVQLARAAGAEPVVGAAGGPAKTAAARELGAHAAVDYDRQDWPEQVRKATGGRGAAVVLDAVGGTIGAQALEAAADAGGRVGIYGFTSGTWTALDTMTLARRGLTVTGPLGITFAKPAAQQRADAEQALAAAAAGRLVPRIHAVRPLEEAAGAHAELAARHSVGALLLAP
ncbi:zinc-binding dehydrogenase [Streptomyces sp. NPDC020983]|uniref:zinc-binding dehydrogenase n=1 Tax=Streptomyces sp. NPDC020983 TaxID=3365106 RepID=UPI0037B2CC5B